MRGNNAPRPQFPTADPAWAKTWDAALAVLAGNVHAMPRYERPVLVEGAVYPGVWLECAPQEGLVYGTLARYVEVHVGVAGPLQIARNNHMAFFAQQKEDGQLPASIKLADAVGTTAGMGRSRWWCRLPRRHGSWCSGRATTICWWRRTRHAAGGMRGCGSIATRGRRGWWRASARTTRGTTTRRGGRACRTGVRMRMRGSARRYAGDAAAVSGSFGDGVWRARGAGADGDALGKPDEAARWQEDAEKIRQLILTKLYSPEDGAFYDLDAKNKFVRVRSDVNSRVLGEHVVDPVKDKAIFEAVWTKQIHNPKAFWAPYPLTSIAMDDPTFVRPIPRNSLGRGEPGADRAAGSAVDGVLRQAGGAEPHDGAVVFGDHEERRVSAADGSDDGRVYDGGPERVLAGGAGVSGLCAAAEPGVDVPAVPREA